jgi:hypothetical protein
MSQGRKVANFILRRSAACGLFTGEFIMKLGFHGETTRTSDLQTNVAMSAQAGFKALELGASQGDWLRWFLFHRIVPF